MSQNGKITYKVWNNWRMHFAIFYNGVSACSVHRERSTDHQRSELSRLWSVLDEFEPEFFDLGVTEVRKSHSIGQNWNEMVLRDKASKSRFSKYQFGLS